MFHAYRNQSIDLNFNWFSMCGIMVINELNFSDFLRGLVPFVEVKKREKYPWRSVTF